MDIPCSTSHGSRSLGVKHQQGLRPLKPARESSRLLLARECPQAGLQLCLACGCLTLLLCYHGPCGFYMVMSDEWQSLWVKGPSYSTVTSYELYLQSCFPGEVTNWELGYLPTCVWHSSSSFWEGMRESLGGLERRTEHNT